MLVNDHMTIEVPVITAILVAMLAMALTTELIGVHTALGAFIAGLLIGQSPILTEHIEGELRGFIIAFFSPVFFAVAGLGMDLRTLMDPTLLLFTAGVILVASFGKFAGALAGGKLGGLSTREALALATGLNARGSTEVIIATIGLAMGALSNQLYNHDRRHGGRHHHGDAADLALDDGARAAARGGSRAPGAGGDRGEPGAAEDGARAGLRRR